MKILHVSTFPPTHCGIASYVANLLTGLKNADNYYCNMCYSPQENQLYDYQININDIHSYHNAVKNINESDLDLVSIQHEYGIFGGDNGELVLELLNGIKLPIVTTLHTVRLDYNKKQKWLLKEICNLSTSLVVLSLTSKQYLIEKFNIPEKKIKFIFHGVSDLSFEYSSNIEKYRDTKNQLIFLTAGHLRPPKGYEISIQALKILLDKKVDCKLLILGTFQQQFEEGKAYFRFLKNFIDDLKLNDNVIWIDQFIEQSKFYELIRACDAAIVSYTEPFHNSSGFIPDVLAIGRPVFCTSFEYANFIKLKTNNCIFISPFSAFSLAQNIIDTYKIYTVQELQKNAYESSRNWTWKCVGEEYQILFKKYIK